MRSIFASLLLSSMIAPGAQAAGDAGAGEHKAQTCMGCHGSPGYSNVYPTYQVPKLGGQHSEYIVAALKAYANQQRSHKTMHANAESLSDQDMADIAAFFAGFE